MQSCSALDVFSGQMLRAQEGGRKTDLAVALLDLARTAAALKQPVPFVDKPAVLFASWTQSELLPVGAEVLVDGLRSSSAASEFCAKRFHSQILPRLSCRREVGLVRACTFMPGPTRWRMRPVVS